MALNRTGLVSTFSDEFNSFSWNSGSDTSVTPNNAANGTWATRYWWGSGDRWLSGNNEQEYYADGSTSVVQTYPGVGPFSVSDGALTITARPSPDASLTAGQPYVSGLITTEGTFAQRYGYFEMRADLPAGQGLWPAFWMLQQDPHGWPPELDVMEVLGHDPTTLHTVVHTNQTGTHTQTGKATATVDLSAGFHTYGVRWAPDKIEWYLDDSLVFSAATPADLNKPMYLLANLAVGGNWPGSPDGTTPWPAEMRIDHIKAYAIPLTLTGTDRADTLVAEAAADRITGGGGNDTMTGGGGGDVFRFGPRSGRDTITDFSPTTGGEVIEFERGLIRGVSTFEQLKAKITDSGGGAVIDLGAGNNITLSKVLKAALSADDFSFL
jgi:beta-glucanase (GH16 family)